ncbi:MAG: hypothetical protein L3K23_02745 [Thermoplasmata archaeon]|nr:hypothetical protein [Thermoplasmata archaeon]
MTAEPGDPPHRWAFVQTFAVIAVLLAVVGSTVVPAHGSDRPNAEGRQLAPSHGVAAPRLAIAPLPSSNFSGPSNWTEQIDYGAVSGTTGSGGLKIQGDSCVANGTFVYCVGGQNFQTGTDLSDVFFANVSAAGVSGPWSETTDYAAASGTTGSGGVGVEFPSCVYYQGYVYCVGGAHSGSPSIVSQVFFAPLSAQGVGAWAETTDYGAASGSSGTGGVAAFDLSCAPANGYAYCVGGGNSKVFFASLSSSGVGAWTETTDFAATSGTSGSGGESVTATSCVTNASYLYCIGGSAGGATSKVFFAPVSSSGVGAWTEATDYGAASGTVGSGGLPIYATACLVYVQWVLCVDGNNRTNTAVDNVSYAQLSSTGVGAWAAGTAYGDAPLFSYYLSCVLAKLNALCTGGGVAEVFLAYLVSTPPGHPALTTSLSSTTVLVGSMFNDTATITGGTVASGELIVFKVYPNGGCLAPLSSYGSAPLLGTTATSPDFTATLPPAGYMSVRATFTGDARNQPAASSCEQLHVLANSRLTTALSQTTARPGGTYGDVATLSATTPNAGGTVTYTQNDDRTCTTPTGQTYIVSVTNGQVGSNALFSTAPSPTSYNSIEVSYSGDANNAPAGPVCEPIPVAAPTRATVTIDCTPTAMTVGQSATCTITVTGSSGPIVGAVVTLYTDSTTGKFSPALCKTGAAGTCTVTYTDTTEGVPTLTASYPGDMNNVGSRGSTTVFNLAQPAVGTASTSTTASGGKSSADQTSSTDVSVSISGSSASDGTNVTIVSVHLAQALAGTPSFPLTNYLGAYDVKVVGLTDGTATVCLANPHVDSASDVEFVTANSWVAASGTQALPGTRVCGNIPVVDLQGTPVSGGDPPASQSKSSGSLGVEELAAIGAAVLVVVVVLAVLLVRGRKRGPAPPATTPAGSAGEPSEMGNPPSSTP